MSVRGMWEELLVLVVHLTMSSSCLEMDLG
jgi:hypothetical protein